MLKFFPSIVLKILGSNLKSSIKLYSIFGRKICLLRPKVLNLCYRIILVTIFLFIAVSLNTLLNIGLNTYRPTLNLYGVMDTNLYPSTTVMTVSFDYDYLFLVFGRKA